MRSAVVVIALAAALSAGLGAGCTRPVDQPADCATYVRCFLAKDGAGYQALIERSKVSPGDPELSCYQGFVNADAIDDLDKLIDPLLNAFDVDGTCWAGGYGGPVSDPSERPDADLEQKYQGPCEEHCKAELAADCARTGDNRICADTDDDAIQFCADPDHADRIQAALCPSEGEGEGGEGEGEGEGE